MIRDKSRRKHTHCLDFANRVLSIYAYFTLAFIWRPLSDILECSTCIYVDISPQPRTSFFGICLTGVNPQWSYGALRVYHHKLDCWCQTTACVNTLIVNMTLQADCSKIWIEMYLLPFAKNMLENVICQMTAILIRHHWVKWSVFYLSSIRSNEVSQKTVSRNITLSQRRGISGEISQLLWYLADPSVALMQRSLPNFKGIHFI